MSRTNHVHHPHQWQYQAAASKSASPPPLPSLQHQVLSVAHNNTLNLKRVLFKLSLAGTRNSLETWDKKIKSTTKTTTKLNRKYCLKMQNMYKYVDDLLCVCRYYWRVQWAMDRGVITNIVMRTRGVIIANFEIVCISKQRLYCIYYILCYNIIYVKPIIFQGLSHCDPWFCRMFLSPDSFLRTTFILIFKNYYFKV